MPYVPQDALELLESYKSECKPYLEQKNKSMDFNKLHDYIHGSLEQKIYANFYAREHESKNVS